MTKRNPIAVGIRAAVKRAERTDLKPTATCETCNKPFYASPGHVAQGWGRFCSLACRSVQFRGDASPRWKGQHRASMICLYCRKGFTVKKSHAAIGEGKYCSMRCFRFALPPSHGYARGGRREDLDNRYFRSSWEANWARYLNWLQDKGQIERWEFEVDTFEFPVKRGNRFYTPDFKVFLPDGSFRYEEVKGWMTPGCKTKLKRMGIYYPQLKIVVIDRAAYSSVAKTMKPLLPCWESAYPPSVGTFKTYWTRRPK